MRRRRWCWLWIILMVVLVYCFLLGGAAIAGGKTGEKIVKVVTDIKALLGGGIVAFLIGLLLSSPWANKLPKKATDFLTFLTGDRFEKLMDAIAGLAGGPASRRLLLIDTIVADSAGTPWPLSVAEATKVVDYLTAKYKQSKGWIDAQRKG